MESLLKLPAQDPSVNDILNLHDALKKNELLEVRDYDGMCYIKYDPYFENDHDFSEPIHIGDFAVVRENDLDLYISNSIDFMNLPIWYEFLKYTDTPLHQFLQDVGPEIEIKLTLSLELGKYARSITPMRASKFLSVREHFTCQDTTLVKQIMALAAVMRLFFGGTNDDLPDDLDKVSELCHEVDSIPNLETITSKVDSNKHITMKSPCLRIFKSNGGSYHTFTCGLPILKTRCFRPFATMPELQMLHLVASSGNINELG